MNTEHLEKACPSADTVLEELRAAQTGNPSDAAVIFSLVQEALKLETKIGVTLSAATQTNAAAKMKGQNHE